MRINQNIMAFNAYRNLASTQGNLAKSLEKLSSGYRIKRAADDASGLVISQGLRAQVSGLQRATRNAQDVVSVVHTAEGALKEVHGVLKRVRDLIIQAANTAASDANAREAAQNEIQRLQLEIDRIAGTTAYKTQTLLNGSVGAHLGSGARAIDITRDGTSGGSGLTFANVGAGVRLITAGAVSAQNTGAGTFQVRAHVTATDPIQVSVGDFRISNGTVGAFTALARIDVTKIATHSAAQGLIDAAITKASDIRGALGAVQNRFESTIANLQVTTENLAASESPIRDTDMALEMVIFTRRQILAQACTAMLAQANQAPRSVLRPLQQ